MPKKKNEGNITDSVANNVTDDRNAILVPA